MVRNWRNELAKNKETDNEAKLQEFEENQQPRHSDAPDVPKLKDVFFGRKK